jgi:hypothetical protein
MYSSPRYLYGPRVPTLEKPKEEMRQRNAQLSRKPQPASPRSWAVLIFIVGIFIFSVETKKTIHLLRFYGEDEETYNEDEHSSASRTRRLRLSRKLGISLAQLNCGLLQM